METIIVILVVGAAAAYCVGVFFKKFKGESKCACGGACSSKGGECGMIEDKPEFTDGEQK